MTQHPFLNFKSDPDTECYANFPEAPLRYSLDLSIPRHKLKSMKKKIYANYDEIFNMLNGR